MQPTNEWQFIIALLSFFVLVSISLNLIILNKLVKAKAQLNAPSFDIDAFPSLIATNFYSRGKITTEITTPTALVFLATNCPKCKTKLPILEQLQIQTQENGVNLQIILHDQMKNIESFFNGSPLIEAIWQLSYSDYKMINSHELSPAYLFINELNEVEGQGSIDDDNWRFFQQQIMDES